MIISIILTIIIKIITTLTLQLYALRIRICIIHYTKTWYKLHQVNEFLVRYFKRVSNSNEKSSSPFS